MYLDSNQQWAVALSTHRKPLYQLQPTRRSCRYPVYWNAAHRSQYSKLYLGTVSGLVAIDCNLPSLTTQSSKVRFTHLKVGNEEIFPGNEYLPLDIAVSKAIRIHERENLFTGISALNYESDNTATYSYRLLGFDNRWIHVPASRRLLLTPICLRETIRCK